MAGQGPPYNDLSSGGPLPAFRELQRRPVVGRAQARLPHARLPQALPTPIQRIPTPRHPRMERRMRPVGHAGDMPVLHRVVVDVIDMAAQVVRVADQVFPVAALPDAAFATRDAVGGTAFAGGQSSREAGLDLRPAIGVVGVALRQSPHAMQVVRQDHPGQQDEWTRRLGRAEGIAQQADVLQQQPAPPFKQVDGEETGTARHPDATIVRHAGSVPGWSMRRHRGKVRIGVGKCRIVTAASRTGGGPGPALQQRYPVGRAQARLTHVIASAGAPNREQAHQSPPAYVRGVLAQV